MRFGEWLLWSFLFLLHAGMLLFFSLLAVVLLWHKGLWSSPAWFSAVCSLVLLWCVSSLWGERPWRNFRRSSSAGIPGKPWRLPGNQES